jgi:hypothetical protein
MQENEDFADEEEDGNSMPGLSDSEPEQQPKNTKNYSHTPKIEKSLNSPEKLPKQSPGAKNKKNKDSDKDSKNPSKMTKS